MDDQTLLSQYLATKDANAFEELMRRYSALVRGVCVRLLGNSHDAEEVAQECFLELARHAGEVHTSLGGWLHRSATSRSLNAIRSRVRRKARERVFGLEAEATTPAVEIAEPDIHRLIQGALKELPDDLRLPMVLHYVDGQSQRDVAVQLGVNQSTISRRMQDALRQLRDKLTQAGYAATAPAMMVLMQEHAATASTETGLTDVPLSGAAGKVAGSTTLISSLKGLATASLPILSFLLLDGWLSLFSSVCVMLYVSRFRPIWVSEVMSSFGLPDLYRQPTFFLARWEWTTPPEGWRTQMRTSISWSVLLIGLTLTFVFGTDQPPWGTVVMGLTVAMVFFVHALRLWRRAAMIAGPRLADIIAATSTDTSLPVQAESSPSNDSSWTWFDATQLTSIGLAGIGTSIPHLLQSQPGIAWPAVALSSTIGVGMLFTGIRLFYRLVISKRSRFHRSECNIEIDVASAGTLTIVAIGAVIVAALTIWVLWNPAGVRSLSLSLAAIQTLMFGWIVYRVATFRRLTSPHLVRRVVIAMLVGCFVLNSGVCLANWFPFEFQL